MSVAAFTPLTWSIERGRVVPEALKPRRIGIDNGRSPWIEGWGQPTTGISPA